MVCKLDFGKILGSTTFLCLFNFGTSMLSCNQMGCRFADIWDGQEVKLTFRRTFDANMLENWCTIVMEFTPLVLFMQS